MFMEKIKNLVEQIVKDNNEIVLLQLLRNEIQKQKNYKYFLMSATDVLEKDCIRYMFVSLPDDSEEKRTKSIENKIGSLVQEYNKQKKVKLR